MKQHEYTQSELDEHYTFLIQYGDEPDCIRFYRAKASGIIRMIDVDSGFDVMAEGGNRIFASDADALAYVRHVMDNSY